MNISASPAFLRACREVLGGDDPGTVINGLRNQKLADQVQQRHEEILSEKVPVLSGRRVRCPDCRDVVQARATCATCNGDGDIPETVPA